MPPSVLNPQKYIQKKCQLDIKGCGNLRSYISKVAEPQMEEAQEEVLNHLLEQSCLLKGNQF